MSESQDTELTLSTGKLLGFFFGLVIICGIFFSLGYAVGKNSAPGASTAIMDSAELSTVTANGGAKPSPGKPLEATPCQEGDSGCAPAAAIAKQEPVTAPPLEMSGGTGLMVQVAAVSKQEDAEAMAAALRKKQYPVLVVPNQTSNLFHVQVGPFADQKDAEAMRARLANDGYNAILKR
jgi:DedD protein